MKNRSASEKKQRETLFLFLAFCLSELDWEREWGVRPNGHRGAAGSGPWCLARSSGLATVTPRFCGWVLRPRPRSDGPPAWGSFDRSEVGTRLPIGGGGFLGCWCLGGGGEQRSSSPAAHGILRCWAAGLSEAEGGPFCVPSPASSHAAATLRQAQHTHTHNPQTLCHQRWALACLTVCLPGAPLKRRVE